jgi:hypothetical protein
MLPSMVFFLTIPLHQHPSSPTDAVAV